MRNSTSCFLFTATITSEAVFKMCVSKQEISINSFQLMFPYRLIFVCFGNQILSNRWNSNILTSAIDGSEDKDITFKNMGRVTVVLNC